MPTEATEATEATAEAVAVSAEATTEAVCMG